MTRTVILLQEFSKCGDMCAQSGWGKNLCPCARCAISPLDLCLRLLRLPSARWPSLALQQQQQQQQGATKSFPPPSSSPTFLLLQADDSPLFRYLPESLSISTVSSSTHRSIPYPPSIHLLYLPSLPFPSTPLLISSRLHRSPPSTPPLPLHFTSSSFPISPKSHLLPFEAST